MKPVCKNFGGVAISGFHDKKISGSNRAFKELPI